MLIGSTKVQKITQQKDMDSFVESLNLSGAKVLIKPNWVSYSTGVYTDAKILDMFLTSLGKPAVLLESHTFWRTDKMVRNEGDYFSSSEATLETGVKHRDFFLEQDRLFLKTTGLGEVISKHNSEYLCLTEEVWNGNRADPSKVKQAVEEKYGSVNIQDLYGIVPQKVFDLKGADLVVLAKAKMDSSYGVSLSIKNSFGLIPDPTRYVKYHGGDAETLLAQSIVDINKIYQSLFPTTFVVEGVFDNCFMDWNTNKATPFFNWGVILGGKDGLEVDSTASKLLGAEYKGPLLNLPGLYKSTFGGNDNIGLMTFDSGYFQKR